MISSNLFITFIEFPVRKDLKYPIHWISAFINVSFQTALNMIILGLVICFVCSGIKAILPSMPTFSLLTGIKAAVAIQLLGWICAIIRGKTV